MSDGDVYFNWLGIIAIRVDGGDEQPDWLQDAIEGTLDPSRVTIISEQPELIAEVDGKPWRLII